MTNGQILRTDIRNADTDRYSDLTFVTITDTDFFVYTFKLYFKIVYKHFNYLTIVEILILSRYNKYIFFLKIIG